MPAWMDKFLFAVFGGTYGSEEADSDKTDGSRPKPDKTEEVAMQTFRRRLSTGASSGFHGRLDAPGFDYIHWKPYGKRRRRYYLNEFPKQCKLLSSYVKDVAYSGHLGLEERRWAGIGLEPAPLGAKRPGTGPSSLQGSRDILTKMGSGPPK